MRQGGRCVPKQGKSSHDQTASTQVICCTNCGAPAGEVQLKHYRGTNTKENVYVCVGGCAKQRNRALVRFIRITRRAMK